MTTVSTVRIPRDAIEQTVGEIWEEVLGVAPIDIRAFSHSEEMKPSRRPCWTGSRTPSAGASTDKPRTVELNPEDDVARSASIVQASGYRLVPLEHSIGPWGLLGGL
jgi:hypothetical protein